MWYQSFGEQKDQKAVREARSSGVYFDGENYTEMMSKFRDQMQEGFGYPLPKKPIGKCTFNIYKACIRRIYKTQVARRVCSLPWDHIWQMGFDDLASHVKERAPMLKKELYEEKVTGEFAPYTVVEHYDQIEQQMWNDSITQHVHRSTCCNLRHRYCLLHLTSGILRCESLYRAELSDFLCIKPPKKDNDIHQMFIMINQIAQGKTNHGRTLYGRATRHKDVRLCCIGALSMYLQYRFHCTGEFRTMPVEDWLDNSKWFDIKLLVDINGSDTTKEMKNDSYARHIRRILKLLQIICDKLLHLGRNLGSKILDLLEEEMEAIRRMGQWNPTVFDNSYSSKIPLGPIRKLAGYTGGCKIYFNTRSTVKPDDVLLRATPIGEWVYQAYDFVSEAATDGKHQTALHVLRFFTELNEIFLQDTAAMFAMYPERKEHNMFNELSVFAMPEFAVRLNFSNRFFPLSFI